MIGLGITVLVLILLWNLPLGVDAEYSEAGAVVKAVAGKLSVVLYPREKKVKKEKEPKKKKPKEKSDAPKEKKGGKITFFKELLGVGFRMLSGIRRKLRMEQLTLHLTVGGAGDDPASAAILYGRAWAAIGALTPILENTFDIRQRDIAAAIDFSEPENVIYARGRITLKLGDILVIAVYYGLRALKIYMNYKKGGNEHGTSHQ